jgi:Lrp/AsnC family transcriptional regulator, leucine-responsive regulatory protein
VQLSVVMDAIDRRILQELQRDGRLPNVALADRVHLSPSACLRRLKALEDEGIIRGYRAILDQRKLGLDLTVFVEVEITGQSPQRAVEFEQAVAEVDEIISCHAVAGSFEFLLQVVVADVAAYERLFHTTLLALPGLGRTRSHIAVRTMKEPSPLPLTV